MSTVPTSGVVHDGDEGRMARIQVEMPVEDASGERFGRVADVRLGARAAMGGESQPRTGAHPIPNLPSEQTERLLHVGHIKIEDTWYFRRDFRYYATIDQVSSVDASVVRLDRHCRDLITTFD
jgi:hypothetical protein